MTVKELLGSVVVGFIVYMALCFFTGVPAFGHTVCQQVNCSHLSKATQDCVIKKRCNPIIRKQNAEIRRLKAYIAKLKRYKRNERVVYKYQKVQVPAFARNSLTLLGGVSNTRLRLNQSTDHTVFSNDHEFDLGLQYMRHMGNWNWALQATVNQSFLFGLGLDW